MPDVTAALPGVDSPPAPEPRFAHEVAPCPDGYQYVDEWRHATDLPKQLATYHAARAWAFHLALLEPGLSAEAMATAIRMMLPEHELAFAWAGIAHTQTATPCDHWQVDMARDALVDPLFPETTGPWLHRLLTTLGIDPDGIRPYDLARITPARTGGGA